jgi:putative endopeptidase
MTKLLITLALFSNHAFAEEPLPPLPPIMDSQALSQTDPCDDFYQFSCGAWLDHTVIPADKSSVSRQVTVAMDSTDADLNKILTSYAAGNFSPRATYSAKIRDFYTTCMNIDKLAPAAAKVAKKRVNGIKGWKTKADFARLIAEMQLNGAGPLFSFGSTQDLDDSSRVIGDAGQGGIALGQRDYYVATDQKGKEILLAYKEHIAKILELNGEHVVAARLASDVILRIETELAKASYVMADQNDPSKTHHPMSAEELSRLAPHFDWATYFKTMGDKFTKHMNVDEPEFFGALDHILASTDKGDLDTYLSWQFLHSVASRLGGDFEKEDFRFWSAYLSGAKQMMPRWKICTRAVEGSLGYALAEAYVQTFDGKGIKAKTEQMIDEIKSTFNADLTQLAKAPPEGWMDAGTAAKASEKIGTIAQKVGGPEKWRDYHTLRTGNVSYLENSLCVNRFESRRDVAKIGKPVDRQEWGMMPWEINAYYDRSKNEFNFPFGILQPPSLDLKATDGANLGSFGGGTIGHELTHGFDNNGSQYDAKGNVKNWWSQETLSQFQAKSGCYVDQANQYNIKLVGLNVNGKNTLEENLADQGGVKLGYVALDKELTTRPEGAVWAGKYSERQQYWIAYAQSWCTQITAENLRERMTTDVHPPAEFRVNAVVMNRPEFAHDFNCKPGAKMAPVNRCSLW